MKENATYVLEQAADRAGRSLQVRAIFKGVNYKRGVFNSSFCTYNGKIYFFPVQQQKHSEVVCLDVDAQESFLYISL